MSSESVVKKPKSQTLDQNSPNSRLSFRESSPIDRIETEANKFEESLPLSP